MENLKTVYCPMCDKDQDFEISVDHNGESVLTCTVCGHSIKFPEKADLDASIAEYNRSNQPSK